MAADRPDHPLLQRPLYAFDLPREILDTLQYKPRSGQPPPDQDTSSSQTAASEASSSSTSATSCALCSLTFENVQEQRSHHRSDLHCYNLKQKIKGLKPVSEADFDKLIGDLDESLSGSDSSDVSSEDDDKQAAASRKETTLSALLKKQAKLSGGEDALTGHTVSKSRSAGQQPIYWFTSSELPSNVTLGLYKNIFDLTEQSLDPTGLVEAVRFKQLKPKSPPQEARSAADQDGGVPLPSVPIAPNTSASGPHYFLCMMGGGHFAGMIVGLTAKSTKNNKGVDDRAATVIAHKTFHRYTTRRKQGGSQSANDSAKGAAHSAGSGLRRYNETALTNEIRELMTEWKPWIDTSSLLFIRASGSTNRRTLYGPYDGQVLQLNDPRNRGFPFNSRRATQAELMRAFVELTRVKIQIIDLEAEANRAAEARASAERARQQATRNAAEAAQAAEDLKQRQEQERISQEAAQHTTQLQALIKRSKAPGLISYLSSNNLDPNYRFHPPTASSNHHTPTPLHLAASSNSSACISALLAKTTADPTLSNSSGKTPFEVAGDRAARDAFRVARHELPTKWDWTAARVGPGMTRSEAEARAAREREEKRLEDERLRIEAEAVARTEAEARSHEVKGPVVKGKGLSLEKKSAQERREDETRGLSDEAKLRLERERRARAVEARLGLG